MEREIKIKINANDDRCDDCACRITDEYGMGGEEEIVYCAAFQHRLLQWFTADNYHRLPQCIAAEKEAANGS